MKRCALTYLLVILGTVSAAGQTGRLYSPGEDLSNSLVNSIYQDGKGFVWIATEDGLNRFDGNKFTIYKHESGDDASMIDNYVRSVLEDSAGNFWVGCMSGLMSYDRATNSFHRVEMYRESKAVSPHVTCIIESTSGDIWLATSGMGLFVIKDGVAESVLTDSLGSNYLTVVYEDSKGRMWIGTENDGMYLYIRGEDEILSFSAPAGISGDNISSIVECSGGNIFAGTLTRGLNRYDEEAGCFRYIPHSDGEQLFIKSLHVNRDDLLYVGTDGQGLKIYNAGTNCIDDYAIHSAPYDFSKGKVHSILQDKDDNLWLGIFQKGLVLIPGSEKKFDYWGFKSIQASPIGNNSVMSVFEDSSGIVWVGTDSDGLYGVNSRGRQVAHFVPTASPTSVSNVILSIYEDSRGEMWLGSYTKGLARFDRTTGECEYIPQLEGEKIYSIAEDGRGNLLVGTYGAGFYTLGLDDRRLTRFESTKKEDDDFGVDALTNDWISDIMLDREGKVWLAHYNGVSCYDPVKKTFLNYLGQNTILPGTVVYVLCEDSAGRIWIGSSDGLYVFDKTDSAVRRMTTEDGLPHNVICGILEDGHGNMWISTYMGVSKFDPDAGKFMNYYAGDGLQGNEFTRGACHAGRQGRMYFGGIYGVTGFIPGEITGTQNKDIRVLITDFYIDNRPVRVGDVSGGRRIVEAPVIDAEHFTMSHAEGTFSIEFSAFEYANPERIVYQYKIEELGTEWINSYRGSHRATYSNLPPGSYTFSVRAQDHENISEPRTILITVTPPLYATRMAYFVYAVLLLLSVYLLEIYFHRRSIRRHEETTRRHAEQINEAKLQFFINISHEIRTPMTLIIHPLEKLIAENPDEPALRKTYVMMHRNARRILRLINQLMDIRKLDKGQMKLRFRRTDIVGFIEEMMRSFDYLAARKNITFDFLHEDEKLDVWIDTDNFDKVLLNILSNAFKYTSEGGNITIVLRRDDTHFEIIVTDSGIGIDESEIENIFERFYQINNELTNANFGTGIGMHLARSLVELHHGTIVAGNREDASGARFTVRMPLGNAHIPEDAIEAGGTVCAADEVSPAAFAFDGLSPAAGRKAKPKTRYKVLVADDESEIRTYISSELAPWFRIVEAGDGKRALEMILSEMPDLVISDVMMPGMDGITLVRKIKQNIIINHIPVVLLTARTTSEERVEGLDVGADAYIAKPFNTEELRSTVSGLIENRERLRGSFSGFGMPGGEMMQKIELKSVDEQFMERVMSFIDEHLSDTDLSVERLASGVGLSRVHLHRRLKHLTGQSAGDFIKGIRLRQAAILIKEGKFSVSEVAYATGFSSLSHFSTSFRDFYGASPTAYANKQV